MRRGRKILYTDEQLLSIFKDEYDKNNDIKLSYFRKENGLPSNKIYEKRFGGITNIKKILNIDIKPKKNQKLESDKNIPKWDFYQILEGVEKLYNSINRKIKPKDIDNCEYLPSYKYMAYKFGGIKYICNILDINFENKKEKSQKEKIKKKKN